ncbi:MAG: DNA polymerase III subunit delta' [Proteobacteria bacterium]|jgi:DNA polymerase-3 subunit delta'|nr:DNA polymerase III subunit delta' [Pseudomonadota bacterium]
MRFSEIRDQEHATSTLRRSVTSGKVPHAYLFTGPEGVGKRRAATTLAMALCCERPGAEPCGACEHCRRIGEAVHPDVRLLGVPDDKKRIPIDAVREASRWLGVRPHEARSKILIIDPAEAMTDAAANAILKTLEEPRAGSFIVLITSAASALLRTVRSRCQVVRFRPLEEATVAAILAEGGADPEAARVAAALSGGSLARATQHVGEELDALLEIVVELLSASAEKTPERALRASEALRGDREKTVAALELALAVLEEVLLARSGRALPVGGGALLSRYSERLAPLLEASSSRAPADDIAAVHRALTAMAQNNMNPQLALEGVVMAARGRRGLGAGWYRIGGR